MSANVFLAGIGPHPLTRRDLDRGAIFTALTLPRSSKAINVKHVRNAKLATIWVPLLFICSSKGLLYVFL